MRLLAAPLLALLLAGCSAAEPPPPGEVIRFTTDDGVTLEGEVRGSGEVAVVLAPGYGEDRAVMAELADFLADRDYLTLAFDLRGTGGSAGAEDVVRSPADVSAAAAEARSRGAKEVFVIGADVGASAALVAAPGESVPLAGIVALSATASFLGLEVSGEAAAAVEEPKLFFAAEGDRLAQSTAESLFAASPPPKRVEVLVGSDHGTAILEGREGEKVRNLILLFLGRYA